MARRPGGDREDERDQTGARRHLPLQEPAERPDGAGLEGPVENPGNPSNAVDAMAENV